MFKIYDADTGVSIGESSNPITIKSDAGTNDEISRLKAVLAIREKVSNEHLAAFNREKEENESLKKKNEVLKEKLANAADLANDYFDRVTDAADKLAIARDTVDRVERQNRSIRECLNNQAQEIDKLQKENHYKQTRIDDLRKEIDRLLKECSEKQQTLDARGRTVMAWDERCAELRNEVGVLKAMLTKVCQMSKEIHEIAEAGEK